MKQVAVLHPYGHGAWVCSFPETGSEPSVLAHDQFIHDLGQQRDSLLADNERLREALERIRKQQETIGQVGNSAWTVADFALDATPAQSLARIRNQVQGEYPYPVFPEDVPEPTKGAPVIRAMKEPQ